MRKVWITSLHSPCSIVTKMQNADKTASSYTREAVEGLINLIGDRRNEGFKIHTVNQTKEMVEALMKTGWFPSLCEAVRVALFLREFCPQTLLFTPEPMAEKVSPRLRGETEGMANRRRKRIRWVREHQKRAMIDGVCYELNSTESPQW